MYTHETSLRVRYGETDQMGFVYYGIYAQYYEVGRVELLRSLGVSYKTLEESGYELPVVSFNIQYKQPAFYDEKITVKTTILEMPTSKITFLYECFNDKNILLNKGEVVLVFVKSDSKKPCRPPAIFIDKISRFL
jgi:acyl-CoA thioester hydrolase